MKKVILGLLKKVEGAIPGLLPKCKQDYFDIISKHEEGNSWPAPKT
jgi:hypothetical protein